MNKYYALKSVIGTFGIIGKINVFNISFKMYCIGVFNLSNMQIQFAHFAQFVGKYLNNKNLLVDI